MVLRPSWTNTALIGRTATGIPPRSWLAPSSDVAHGRMASAVRRFVIVIVIVIGAGRPVVNRLEKEGDELRFLCTQ